MNGMKNVRLVIGRSHLAFGEKVAEKLICQFGASSDLMAQAEISDFPNSEIRIKGIAGNLRDADVFIIQTGGQNEGKSVNDFLLELLLLIDASKRSSAKRITAVIPCFPYARQDRKTSSRIPISAKVVAQILSAVGANRLLTMDLHANQVQGFFEIPVDNLYASKVFIEAIREYFKNFQELVIVAPDVGAAKRAGAYARILGCELAIINKKRDKNLQAFAVNIIGDVAGKKVLIIDDMIDTAGTLVAGAEALVTNGASEVYACMTHPILSGEAIQKVNSSPIKKIFVSDTLPLSSSAKNTEKFKLVSVSELFAQAISIIGNGGSMSSLFNEFEE